MEMATHTTIFVKKIRNTKNIILYRENDENETCILLTSLVLLIMIIIIHIVMNCASQMHIIHLPLVILTGNDQAFKSEANGSFVKLPV